MLHTSEKKLYFVITILFSILAFGLGYLTFAFYAPKTTNQTAHPLPASDTQVENGTPIKAEDIVYQQPYVGYVTPIHEAEIQPFIAGFIERIFVKGGDRVKQGDLLLVLDQRPYLATLDSARAQVAKAQATLENATLYYQRMQNASTAVSPTDKDNARTSFLTAQAEFENAKASYRTAQINYDYTMIYAPIDGIVGNVSLTKGNYVSPESGALFSIVRYDPIRVVFSLTDKEYLRHLTSNKPFSDDTIRLELADGRLLDNSGKFAYTANSADRATDSMAVYAEFSNKNKLLTPNAFVRVILEKTFENSVYILKNLVSLEPNGNFIYIRRNGQIFKEKIRILADDDTRFIVQNTFQAGDMLTNATSADSDTTNKL